jgi:hypothetical protein
MGGWDPGYRRTGNEEGGLTGLYALHTLLKWPCARYLRYRDYVIGVCYRDFAYHRFLALGPKLTRACGRRHGYNFDRISMSRDFIYIH